MISPGDEKLLKKLGAHIKHLRLNKQLSLREFADDAEIAFSTLHRIEEGTANPGYLTLLKIADALDINVQKLVTLD